MRRSIFSDLPSPPPGQTGWMWTAESSQNPEKTADSYPLPRITVVTPSYNQGQFIEATIRSVLLQDYPNLEYIIIDGGSTDNSVAIIQKYAPWLAFWVSEKDHGQAHAINKGFARATGDIYAYLNSDDYYEPGALNGCARAFRDGHQWVVGQVRCWQARRRILAISRASRQKFRQMVFELPDSAGGLFLVRRAAPRDGRVPRRLERHHRLRVLAPIPVCQEDRAFCDRTADGRLPPAFPIQDGRPEIRIHPGRQPCSGAVQTPPDRTAAGMAVGCAPAPSGAGTGNEGGLTPENGGFQGCDAAVDGGLRGLAAFGIRLSRVFSGPQRTVGPQSKRAVIAEVWPEWDE